MAARSIASLSLTFGLVSIPIKVFSATESKSKVTFNMLGPDGSPVKQQLVSSSTGKVVPRDETVKGYEFDNGRYVTFTKEELKALEDSPRQTIDILAFIPEKSVDPIYYDKAYNLAPDKRGAKPYRLLLEAMRETGRVALARWAWKGKEYVVQVRPSGDDGLVLQQLFYADEVRPITQLDIEKPPVADAEKKLAVQLIEQIAEPGYDPNAYEDEERKRILDAIDKKIHGGQIVEPVEVAQPAVTGEVIDLTELLKRSLRGGRPPQGAEPSAAQPTTPAEVVEAVAPKARRGTKRSTEAVEPTTPARKRAKG